MKKEPLISIIIPVYEVEEYLPACIESILSQSFKDYELILVPNGLSSDGCPALCDGYAEQDARVTVIHIKDGGVSAARNRGLSSAHRKYLLFIDGDDFIAENSLENLADTLEKDGCSDIIFLNVALYFNSDGSIKHFGNIFDKSRLFNRSKKDALRFISGISNFNTSVCLKLIRREILYSASGTVLFNENITFAEDSDFSLKLFTYARTYNYCGSYIYFYRKERKGSATYVYSEKKYGDLLYVISEWAEKAAVNTDCIDNIDISEEIYEILAFQYCLLLQSYGKIDSISRKKFKAATKKYAWLLNKTKDGRVSMFKWFYRFFGLGLTCFALKIRGMIVKQ